MLFICLSLSIFFIRYMDKKLSSTLLSSSLNLKMNRADLFFVCTVKLNGNRKVTGILRGYDQFMNLVLDNAVEEVSPNERNEIGMVVRHLILLTS
jgi:small nuclear ribonucleoprotein (snRNP)-like protein